jgi:transcriptional regulator with XRE-family HTH domain
MRGAVRWRGSKRLAAVHVRRVALCTSVRQDAAMAAPELNTGDYPEEDRVRLGTAVRRAREAAGMRTRKELALRASVSLRSIAKLESPIGERPVGRRVLEAVARALPGWHEDDPQRILEGGTEAPPRPLTLLEQAVDQLSSLDVPELLEASRRWLMRLSPTEYDKALAEALRRRQETLQRATDRDTEGRKAT